MSRRESTFWPALLVVVGLGLCWPFFSGQSMLGFRDTAHFYYPLFQWLDTERAAGHPPQWIPFDACGLPRVADAGTCPAYPLQLIFRLPGISFPARFGWYIAVHLVLALLGAYVAARRLRLAPATSAFAAFSYGLGGATLSQTCNLVYLIGSAWLPWWLAGVFSLLQVHAAPSPPSLRRCRGLTSMIGVALPLSMLILGGDPQTAYLAILILAGVLAAALVAPTQRTRRAELRQATRPIPHQAISYSPSPSLGEGRPHDAAGEGPAGTQPARGNPPLRPHRAGDSPPRTGESEFEARLASHESPQTPPTGESELGAQSAKRHRGTTPAKSTVESAGETRLRWRFAGRVLLAGATAAGLSAAAWLPQLTWNQRSVRTYTNAPRSVWEWVAGGGNSAQPGPAAGARTAAGAGEMDSAYEFSLPPWALAELFAPTIVGKLFPIHRRWDAGFPAADRIWYPSLYPGVLVTLLLLGAGAAALASRRKRHRPDIHRQRVRGAPAVQRQTGPELFLLWTMLALGMLAAFGWYGLGWLWRELWTAGGWPAQPGIPPQAGGIYWWMQWLLPGFCQFRYPAKLFVLASLALPLLAAIALERFSRRQSTRTLASLALVHAGLCLLGLAAMWIFGDQLQRVAIPADASFGPFDAAGAIADLQRSLVQAAAVALVLAMLTWRSRLSLGLASWKVRGLACLALADLFIANSWLLPSVPADVATHGAGRASVESTSTNVTSAGELEPTPPDLAPPRGDLLTRAVDPAWESRSSPQRLAEILRFQNATDFPKFHLLHGRRIFPAFNSIEPQDLVWLENWLDAHPQRASDFWGLADIGPWTKPVLQIVPAVAATLESAGATVGSAPAAIALRTRARLRPADRSTFQDMLDRDLAWLRSTPPAAQANLIVGPESENSCERVRIRLTCAEPCCLVVGNYWDPGWSAALRDRRGGPEQQLEVQRFAGVLQCIPITRAGDYELELRYAPRSVWWGNLISSLSAAVCLAAIAWSWRKMSWRITSWRKTGQSPGSRATAELPR